MGPCVAGRAAHACALYRGKGVQAKGLHLNDPPSSADVPSPAASQDPAACDQLPGYILTKAWSGGDAVPGPAENFP